MADIRVGVIAPDFELPDDSGKRVRLSSLRGTWVVFTFYAEDDTPVCSKQMCSVRDAYAELREARAVVFGISPDDVESHAAWRAREKFAFALLSDAGNSVASKYGAHGEKLMYGRKVVGVIRTTVIVDPAGRVAFLQRKIRSAGHGARVAVALRAAQAAAAARAG